MCPWLGEEVRVTPKLQGSRVAGGEQLGDGVLGGAALIHGGGVGTRWGGWGPRAGCKLGASWGRLWEVERDLNVWPSAMGRRGLGTYLGLCGWHL